MNEARTVVITAMVGLVAGLYGYHLGYLRGLEKEATMMGVCLTTLDLALKEAEQCAVDQAKRAPSKPSSTSTAYEVRCW